MQVSGQRYYLDVKHPVRLVAAVLQRACGNAEVSFEGDLSAVSFDGIDGASHRPTLVLKRNTIHPKHDFVVLP